MQVQLELCTTSVFSLVHVPSANMEWEELLSNTAASHQGRTGVLISLLRGSRTACLCKKVRCFSSKFSVSHVRGAWLTCVCSC